jgi:hypothetical protein
MGGGGGREENYIGELPNCQNNLTVYQQHTNHKQAQSKTAPTIAS